MSLELGIVGLPNVGKSTLFNALAGTSAPCSNYPFCTVKENVGVVTVPDERLTRLGEILQPEKLTHTTIRFVDIAGLVRGASRGEGLGNKFLATIREVDAIANVVRCFDSPGVSHVEGAIDPERDIDIVRTELLLADLETVERNLKKCAKDAARGSKEAAQSVTHLERLRQWIDGGRAVREMTLSDREREVVQGYRLLTAKESLFVANISEGDVGEGEREWVQRVVRATGEPEWKVVPICASLEAELASLDPDEREEFLSGWNINEPGLARLVAAGYRLLDLVTFFTIKGTEVRAWTVESGTALSRAAGKIHSDMEKGFIRAEVVSYDALVEDGSMHAARERGRVRTEGRDAVVEDGDVVLVHFH
jgi:GTP-binding protein YchF